ncbi:hypothetical protein HCH_05151 [Hahella chejuensis KCTC 2396]|uniref:Uncharacterized protein n=1 Tax=Hahella chejuensis (strain KCTC 2396) TaxID=349521 RepID=Q2SBZ3_HAHCH|nr:DUF6683 family protein [Hahella chejuensis]ABC31831.1 hypothetical protein HCH_05151 [Hahella chejuensis KCTC 2396]
MRVPGILYSIFLPLLCLWGHTANASSEALDDIAGSMNSAFEMALSEVGDAASAAGGDKGAVPEKGAFFTPSKAVSAEIKEKMIAEMLKKAPADKEAELRAAFAEINILQLMGDAVKKDGYQANDLALAMAAWVTTSFSILNDQETNDAEDRAVWKQFRQVIATNPSLAELSDRDKQITAETLYWYSALAANDYQQAKAGTPGWKLDEVKDYVKRDLKARKIHPELVTISAEGGLVARK